MMRTRNAAAAACALLLMSSAALAEDDATDTTQRVEVPEAGVAITFPAAWSVDIEMRQREDWGFVVEDDDEPLAFWKVVYASDGGRPWCDLTWYPTHPMSVEEHASLQEELMTPTYADVERPIEAAAVTLPAADARRLVIFNEPTDDWTTIHLLDLAEGRYLLQCVDDRRADDDWLGLAESLEDLAATAPQPSPEAED